MCLRSADPAPVATSSTVTVAAKPAATANGAVAVARYSTVGAGSLATTTGSAHMTAS